MFYNVDCVDPHSQPDLYMWFLYIWFPLLRSDIIVLCRHRCTDFCLWFDDLCFTLRVDLTLQIEIMKFVFSFRIRVARTSCCCCFVTSRLAQNKVVGDWVCFMRPFIYLFIGFFCFVCFCFVRACVIVYVYVVLEDTAVFHYLWCPFVFHWETQCLISRVRFVVCCDEPSIGLGLHHSSPCFFYDCVSFCLWLECTRPGM